MSRLEVEVQMVRLLAFKTNARSVSMGVGMSHMQNYAKCRHQSSYSHSLF